MGAEAHVKALPAEVLETLLGQPALVEPFVCCYPPAVIPGTPGHILEALLKNPTVTEMRHSNLEWLREESPEQSEVLVALSQQPHLYLDKAWVPLAEFIASLDASVEVTRSIMGGREIGPDLGYGCARYLDTEEVAATARALESLSPDTFPHEVIGRLFHSLLAYYQGAAGQGYAVLQHLA